MRIYTLTIPQELFVVYFHILLRLIEVLHIKDACHDSLLPHIEVKLLQPQLIGTSGLLSHGGLLILIVCVQCVGIHGIRRFVGCVGVVFIVLRLADN